LHKRALYIKKFDKKLSMQRYRNAILTESQLSSSFKKQTLKRTVYRLARLIVLSSFRINVLQLLNTLFVAGVVLMNTGVEAPPLRLASSPEWNCFFGIVTAIAANINPKRSASSSWLRELGSNTPIWAVGAYTALKMPNALALPPRAPCLPAASRLPTVADSFFLFRGWLLHVFFVSSTQPGQLRFVLPAKYR
jgi:hypothetical protein